MATVSISDLLDFSVYSDFSVEGKLHAAAIMALMLPATEKHFLGIAEENLMAATERAGMNKDKVLDVLGRLMEIGLVLHKLSQEGTSGPFAHRYRVNGEKVRIRFVPPTT